MFVPVFVSSTFADFHGERDAFLRLGVPRLNAALDDYGAQVEIIDLRWGVDTTVAAEEEAKHDAVLMTCLRAINRSHPLFVGLVSDRFGWTPPDPERIALAVDDAMADVEQSRAVAAASGLPAELVPPAAAERGAPPVPPVSVASRCR